MDFSYNEDLIYYEKIGSGNPIIFLHGWGSAHIDFLRVAESIKSKYTVYLIDLPGFGNSSTLKKAYMLDDYVLFLESFINKLNLKKVIIVGHSFGGRIAIRYAARHVVDKMILISAAGIKNKSLKIRFKVWKYKLKKAYYIKTNNISKLEKLKETSGSSDYLNSSETLKKTLANVVNTDQTKELKNITCEVLLLWGKNDQVTKTEAGEKMAALIPNSEIIWFLNSGHFLYLEEEFKFISIMKSYLGVEL